MRSRSVKKLPMDKAAALLLSKGVKTLNDFKRMKRDGERPPTVPSNPETYYDDYPGWKGFIKLGDSVAPEGATELTYEDVKMLNLRLGLKSKPAYFSAIEDNVLPAGTPTKPESYFAESWVSWQEFLAPKSKFVSFEEARRFARTLGLKSSYEWRNYCRQGTKPDYIPVLPDQHYQEFTSWEEFLTGQEH